MSPPRDVSSCRGFKKREFFYCIFLRERTADAAEVFVAPKRKSRTSHQKRHVTKCYTFDAEISIFTAFLLRALFGWFANLAKYLKVENEQIPSSVSQLFSVALLFCQKHISRSPCRLPIFVGTEKNFRVHPPPPFFVAVSTPNLLG